MIDIVQLRILAGRGGHGRISFRREKYVPKGGPDGGAGGDGGSVIIKATNHYSTLAHLAGIAGVESEDGEMGGDKQKTGKQAADQVIEVPVGTVVWQREAQHEMAMTGVPASQLQAVKGKPRNIKYEFEEEGERIKVPEGPGELQMERLNTGAYSLQEEGVDKKELVRLSNHNQEFVLCRGGFGGKGNVLFKGPARTTPLIAEYGTPGEERVVVLELQLLADLGLVGFPNAGKSTLISKVTKSRPKIASYPFTTLEPNLGVWGLGESTSSGQDSSGKGSAAVRKHEIVVADIPGLIEGASQGKGLGYDFLRHVKACQALLYVLFLEEEVIFDEDVSWVEKAELVWQQFQTLHQELADYDADLPSKPSLISINKIDIYPTELVAALQEKFTAEKKSVTLFSGVTGAGFSELEQKVLDIAV
jgi:GTPase